MFVLSLVDYKTVGRVAERRKHGRGGEEVVKLFVHTVHGPEWWYESNTLQLSDDMLPVLPNPELKAEPRIPRNVVDKPC